MSLPTAYQISPSPLQHQTDMGQPGAKRKRSPEVASNVGASNPGLQAINYLVRSRSALKLVEADAETFVDILATLEEYEGVLQRQESLAANLGAKLMGPLLLKSIEKLFDGPIKVFAVGDENSTRVTWLDIVSLSRTDPAAFVLNNAAQGPKACRFFVKGQGIEITEDDYRLLMSGAPERMLPSTPIPEDEAAELGTLTILEARLGTIIRKADAVASKARQLNYHLKQRKGGLDARKAALDPEAAAHYSQAFSPINTIRSTVPGQNGEAARLQQDLLMQFSTAVAPSPVTVDIAALQHRRPAGTPSSRPAKKHQTAHAHTPSLGAEMIPGPEGFDLPPVAPAPVRRPPGAPLYDELIDGRFRLEMANRIEKLARGDPIYPPCDRCRRLKFDCAKHLTACTACTRKHAKCSWKDVREQELREPIPPPPQQPRTEGSVPPGMEHYGPINIIQRRPTSDSGSIGTGSSIEGLEQLGGDQVIKAEARQSSEQPRREPSQPLREPSREPVLAVEKVQALKDIVAAPTPSSTANVNVAQTADMGMGINSPAVQARELPAPVAPIAPVSQPAPPPEQAPRDNVDHSALAQMASAAVAAGSEQ